MTCNGCRSHVEDVLRKVDGVKSASVDLEKAEAIIEMQKHIPVDVFENALQKQGGTYHISEGSGASDSPEDKKNPIAEHKPAHAMTHEYEVTGMTCNGCRSHVEETLQQVEGVKKASVDLENAEAVVEMEKHVPIDILENALQHSGGNYHILPKKLSKNSTEERDSAETSSAEKHNEQGEMTHTYKVSGMTCNG